MTDAAQPEKTTSMEEIHRIARLQVSELNIVLAKLLVDAVDQIQDEQGTFRNEESTVYLFDRANEALAAHLMPPNVVAALGRMSAALIVRLSEKAGIDPAKMIASYAEYVEETTPRE